MSDLISPAELRSYRNRLCEWRAPEEFVELAGELREKIGALQFHTDANAAFGRDAWVAAKLASVSKAEAVRLGPDQWPDYEARIGPTVHQYEITEADIKGRRRGDEYRAAAERGPEREFDSGENVIARAKQIPSSLRQAAERKAKKRYHAGARLVIYLNIGDHGWMTEESEAGMAEATEPAKLAFRQVWVLWKTRLYLLWDHAEREGLVVTLPGENSRQLPIEEVF